MTAESQIDAAPDISPFANRLKKRLKHMRKWARRWPTSAYRVYDRDIPEYRWTVDLYGPHVYAQCFSGKESDAARDAQVRVAIAELTGAAEDQLHFRERHRQKGAAQYEKQGATGRRVVVSEGDLKFWVNLDDYIDTGLFLDHREQRRMVATLIAERRAAGDGVAMLNLFSYTGAFSVWAAAAGAHVTTVDLSNTYLDWARDNFVLNDLDVQAHAFVRSDILRYLPQERARGGRYDVIVLDPPTFSRSKKMEQDLDVQRDWADMVNHCLALLRKDGVIFYSTNFRDFELDATRLGPCEISETTKRTTPDDFRQGIHRSWRIEATQS